MDAGDLVGGRAQRQQALDALGVGFAAAKRADIETIGVECGLQREIVTAFGALGAELRGHCHHRGKGEGKRQGRRGGAPPQQRGEAAAEQCDDDRIDQEKRQRRRQQDAPEIARLGIGVARPPCLER